MGVKHFYRASNVAYKQQQQFWSISPKTIPARGWACHQWRKALCNNNLHILGIIITQEGHYVVIKHRNDSLLKFCCFRATRGPNGLNNQTENIFLVKNDVFGSEITQINKFDQFLEVLENSRLSLNPLVPREFSKFRRNQKVKVKLQNDILAAKMAVERQILDML